MTLDNSRTVEQLLAALEAGESARFLLFWGHRPSKDRRITKACFSQWYEAFFSVDGVDYRSAEHYMMAAKAALFGDLPTRDAVLTATTPGAAKALGRQVAGFDEEIWARERMRIVIEANLAKFGQNARLGDFLRQTGSHVLVEASPVDAVWGIGLAEDDPDALHPVRWRGLNLLGFALMEVRSQLSRQ